MGLDEKLINTNIPDMINSVTSKVVRDLSGYGMVKQKQVVDNIISFVGLSGGVGNSTLVANLAHLMSKQGLNVLVIDTNIMYPMQHSLFDIRQDIKRPDLFSFLTGETTLGESIVYLNRNLGVMYANNRTLINFVDTDSRECSNNLSEALDRLCNLFDVVLIDASLRMEYDLVNTAVYKSDAIYCVMDENLGCLANYARFKNALQNSGIDSIKLHTIMNKRTNIQYADVFKQFEMDLITVLPFDTSIIKSGLRNQIFCDKGSSSSKNATIFLNRLKQLKDSVLAIGGYAKGANKYVEDTSIIQEESR